MFMALRGKLGVRHRSLYRLLSAALELLQVFHILTTVEKWRIFIINYYVREFSAKLHFICSGGESREIFTRVHYIYIYI